MKQKKFIVDLKKINLLKENFIKAKEEIIVMFEGKQERSKHVALVKKEEPLFNEVKEVLYFNVDNPYVLELKTILESGQKVSKRNVVPEIYQSIMDNQDNFEKRATFIYDDFHLLEIYSHPNREDVGILTLYDKDVQLVGRELVRMNEEYEKVKSQFWIIDEISDLEKFENRGDLINKSYYDLIKKPENINICEDILNFSEYLNVKDEYLKVEFARKILLIGSQEDKKVFSSEKV